LSCWIPSAPFRHRRLNFQRLAVAQHRELGHVADKQERQPGA
jgi:hypothetical protein